MEPNELGRLGRRARQRVEAALDADDLEEAQRACEPLGKEYVLIHKGLRKVLEYAMQCVETIFREEQDRIAQRIAEAVRRGDGKQARELLEERDRQHQIIHDLHIDMKAGLYSYAGRAFGDRRLEELLRHTGERQRDGFARWESLSVEDFVRATAHLMKTHMSVLRVTETRDKFTFTLAPCGSGGRLIRDGAYEGSKGLYRITGAQPMTFGRPGFPSYCSHCAVWNNIQCIEWFGHPQWCIDPPETATSPCRFHIYKDPRKIPERYYRRVGKQPRRAGSRVEKAQPGQNNAGANGCLR